MKASIFCAAVALIAHACPAAASGDVFKDALFSDRTGFLLQVPALGLHQPLRRRATDGLSDDFIAKAADANEKEDVSAAAAIQLVTMRTAQDGDSAWAAGPAVPQAARLYTAGAVDFARGRLEEAASRFKNILVLPWESARARAAWAAFMLGRIALAQQDLTGTQTFFPQTRTLVLQGARDDLGLAVASYGEQARLLLRRGRVPEAVALYTAQASHDAQREQALQSLQCAAGLALKTPAFLSAAVADPPTRDMLLRYAVAASADDPQFESRAVLDAVLASPRADDPADALAALAYRNGDYARAEAFAERAPKPFALWLRAKLALHAGQAGEAASLFDQALRSSGFAAGTDSQTRLAMETGAAHIRHGDFVLALQAMWPVAANNEAKEDLDYVNDAFYVAERVLTVPELKDFVDATVPPDRQDSPSSTLRDLLARRLARAGRWQDALAYYGKPETRADAAAFIQATDRSSNAHGLDRAQAFWTAATLMRRKGLEMTATELWPDGAESDGMMEYPYNMLGPPFPRDASEFTIAELQRYTLNRPDPDRRFHYRYAAVQLAQESWRALPARSQAAAAILCAAASWMRSSHDPVAERAVWRQYVQTGAVVGFATHFGSRCPAPDFSKAGATRRHLAIVRAHDFIHRHKVLLGLATLGLLLAGKASSPFLKKRTKKLLSVWRATA